MLRHWFHLWISRYCRFVIYVKTFKRYDFCHAPTRNITVFITPAALSFKRKKVILCQIAIYSQFELGLDFDWTILASIFFDKKQWTWIPVLGDSPACFRCFPADTQQTYEFCRSWWHADEVKMCSAPQHYAATSMFYDFRPSHTCALYLLLNASLHFCFHYCQLHFFFYVKL